MAIYILFRILFGTRQVLNKRISLCPSPIVRPEVNIGIIYIRISCNALPTVKIAFTPPGSLGTDGYQMIRIKTADERWGFCKPFFKSRKRFRWEGTRFIADLPRHDGGIILIGQTCITIRTAKDKAHIIVEQLMGFLVCGIFTHCLHEGWIAILIRTWLFSLACML